MKHTIKELEATNARLTTELGEALRERDEVRVHNTQLVGEALILKQRIGDLDRHIAALHDGSIGQPRFADEKWEG